MDLGTAFLAGGCVSRVACCSSPLPLLRLCLLMPCLCFILLSPPLPNPKHVHACLSPCHACWLLWHVLPACTSLSPLSDSSSHHASLFFFFFLVHSTVSFSLSLSLSGWKARRQMGVATRTWCVPDPLLGGKELRINSAVCIFGDKGMAWHGTCGFLLFAPPSCSCMWSGTSCLS